MTSIFSIIPQDTGFTIAAQDKILQTPGKHAFTVPTLALAEAVTAEWGNQKKFNSALMPLTALAYTAIDRIENQQPNIVEALLVYIDTETLSYRAEASDELAKRQEEQWGAILAWAQKSFGVTWEVTKGIMPISQPQELHWAVSKYLRSLDAMRLSAACMLASGCSSLALALAVLEKHISAEEAFRLSRLEEDTQAEKWGRDEETETRAKRLKDEIIAAERFLHLLDSE